MKDNIVLAIGQIRCLHESAVAWAPQHYSGFVEGTDLISLQDAAIVAKVLVSRVKSRTANIVLTVNSLVGGDLVRSQV